MDHPGNTQQRICPNCGGPVSEGGACTPCVLLMAMDREGDEELARAIEAEDLEESLCDLEQLIQGRGPKQFARAFRFGDYELKERLGEGGMGVVFRGLKLSLNKEVALKFIRSGREASERQVSLFLREAELASQLDHPNIATVYEVGRYGGHHFLVMRLVEGRPLSELAATEEFDRKPGSVVRLMHGIASTVHFAHQRGIIHRDLKPGNVMVGSDGALCVMDFGLARWSEGQSTMTIGDFMAGTPSYVSPEQALGKRDSLTVSSDVWSLGVMFYQLLTGCLPFQGESIPSIVHEIVNKDPASFDELSSRDDHAGIRSARVEEMVPGVSPSRRRDLECIIQRCLEKEPHRRYSTAGEFADDLAAWMEGRAVSVRPLSGLERGWRWGRRHPATVAAAGGLLAAVFALGVTAWQRKVSDEREEQRRASKYVADMNLAQRALQESNFIAFRKAMDSALPRKGQQDLRGLEWGLMNGVASTFGTIPVYQVDGVIHAVAVDSRRDRIAIATAHDCLLMNSKGETVRTWPMEVDAVGCTLRFSPSDKFLAAGSSAGLFLMDMDTGSRQLLTNSALRVMTFSPDGTRLAATSTAKSSSDEALGVAIFEPRTSRLSSFISSADGPTLAWEGDGRRLVMAGRWGQISYLENGADTFVQADDGGYDCTSSLLSNDGRFLARTSRFGTMLVWDIKLQSVVLLERGYLATGSRFAFSRDGRLLACTTTVNSVKIFEFTKESGGVKSKLLTHVQPSHTGPITGMDFDDAGGELWTVSQDGTLRRTLLGAEPRSAYKVVHHQVTSGLIAPPRFSPDGKKVAMVVSSNIRDSSTNSWSSVVACDSGSVITRLPGEVLEWTDAGEILTYDRRGMAAVYKLDERGKAEEKARYVISTNVTSATLPTFADHRKWLLHIDTGGQVHRIRTTDGMDSVLEEIRADGIHASSTAPVAVINLSKSGTRFWNLERNQVRALGDKVPAEVVFSPSGALFAISYYDWGLEIFDGKTGGWLYSLEGQQGAVQFMAFTPDDKQLIVGSEDYALTIWNLSTRLVTYRDRMSMAIWWVSVSPDTRWLVTGHFPSGDTERHMTVGLGEYRIWPILGLDREAALQNRHGGGASLSSLGALLNRETFGERGKQPN